jgi:hypothetical protein
MPYLHWLLLVVSGVVIGMLAYHPIRMAAIREPEQGRDLRLSVWVGTVLTGVYATMVAECPWRAMNGVPWGPYNTGLLCASIGAILIGFIVHLSTPRPKGWQVYTAMALVAAAVGVPITFA